MKTSMSGTQQGEDTASGAGTPERILIVEDSKGVRELMFDILTKAGYEWRAVSSDREALALLNSGERFDLMLCFVKQSARDHFAGSDPAKLSENASPHIH